MRLIGQAHTLVHQNKVLRIQSDIRVGTRYLLFPTPNNVHMAHTSLRTDKVQHFSEKVSKVESLLAADKGAAEKKVGSPPAAPVKKKADAADVPSTPSVQEPLSPATNQGTWASMFKK